jgi:hypothetical protein
MRFLVIVFHGRNCLGKERTWVTARSVFSKRRSLDAPRFLQERSDQQLQFLRLSQNIPLPGIGHQHNRRVLL